MSDFQVRNGLVVNSTALVVNTSAGTTGVNTATAAVTLDVNGADAIRVAVGNTGQRPTATSGLVRFNSDTQHLETVVAGTFVLLYHLGEIGAI